MILGLGMDRDRDWVRVKASWGWYMNIKRTRKNLQGTHRR